MNSDLVEICREFLQRARIHPGSKILVAYSGGPDSTALLAALAECAATYPLALEAAHYNHSLRIDSQNDELFVARHTRLFGIHLNCGSAAEGEIEAYADDRGNGLEAAARRFRYLFLEAVSTERRCEYVALGHTLDDNVETILQRVLQGSGTDGLTGIAPTRGRYIRPLIGCTREDIADFLTSRSLQYIHDPTNDSDRFVRNRLRNNIVPVLKTYFPGYRSGLLALAEKMQYADEAVGIQARHDLPFLVDATRQSVSMDLDRYNRASPAIRLKALYEAFDTVTSATPFEERALPYRAIRRLVSENINSNMRRVFFGSGIEIAHERGRLRIMRQVVFPDEKGYLILVNFGDTAEIEVAGKKLRVFLGKRREAVDLQKKNRKSGPLIVRSRVSGDFVLERGGSLAVKELLGKWGVPPKDRWRIPVVQGRDGIIAVIGKPFGFRDWIRSTEKSYFEGYGGSILSLEWTNE